MSINILGGLAKGFSLATPHESITRPTSVLLKRRLFDYMQSFQGYQFVDICAGSGSIGLEALSRGAESSIFIENNPKAYKVLQENIKKFENKFGEFNLKAHRLAFDKWLVKFFIEYESLSDEAKSSYILFFDPPYEKRDFYEKFFSQLRENSYKGLVVVEGCRQKTMPQDEFIQKFGEPDRNYQQGTSFLFLYDYN